MYMTQDDILNQLIELEAEGMPIDEALDLAAWAVGQGQENVAYVHIEKVHMTNRKYAIHRWVDAPEIGFNGRRLSHNPIAEGFRSIVDAEVYMRKHGFSNILYKVVRYN